MEIRRARDPDVDGALAVWQRSLAAEGTRPSKDRLGALRGELSAAGVLLVVAADDADVHGFALAGLDGDLVRVSALHVAPDRRRHGLGGQLLEALADAAYVSGARRLVLESVGAPEFLLGAGLAPVGSREVTGRQAVEYEAALEPPVQDLVVRDDGLRLGQLLKLAAFVDTGAQAKALLEAGGVQVNGEVEVRRGRQVAAGDVVVAQDRAVRVVPA